MLAKIQKMKNTIDKISEGMYTFITMSNLEMKFAKLNPKLLNAEYFALFSLGIKSILKL